jgi:hypothetical protein
MAARSVLLAAVNHASATSATITPFQCTTAAPAQRVLAPGYGEWRRRAGLRPDLGSIASLRHEAEELRGPSII